MELYKSSFIVYTHWHRGETKRGQSPEYILKSSKKKYLMNTLYDGELLNCCPKCFDLILIATYLSFDIQIWYFLLQSFI